MSRHIYNALWKGVIAAWIIAFGLIPPPLSAQNAAPPTSWASKPIDEIRAAAEKGDVTAQIALGNSYLVGESVKQDPAEAAKWFGKAAEARDPLARFVMGMLYDEGKGVPKDKTEAARWYRLAAEQGLPEAQFNLGVSLLRGDGAPKDEIEAANWFRLAAEKGDPQAQTHLGLLLREGRGVQRNPAEAIKWLRRAAYQNDSVAQFFLGLCYRDGDGVERDVSEAMKWIRRSADAGYADAQFALGSALLEGGPAEKNPAEGILWLTKAAENGSLHAQFKLGQALLNGTAGTTNITDGLKWIREAAAQGHVGAQQAIISNFGWVASTNNSLVIASNAPPAPAESIPQPKPYLQAPTNTGETNYTAITDSPPARASANTPGLTASAPNNAAPERRPVLETIPPPQAVAPERFGLGTVLAVSAGTSAAVIGLALLIVFSFFKSRLNDLSREITSTKHELARANQNLAIMVDFVERRAIAERTPPPKPIADITKAAIAATSSDLTQFKSHRSRSKSGD